MAATRGAEALSPTIVTPTRAEKYIASELARLHAIQNDPKVNPENVPDQILQRIDKYSGELSIRRRNGDKVSAAFMTEDMNITEVALVLVALGRAYAQYLEDRMKDPAWTEDIRYLDWKRATEHYARVNHAFDPAQQS